MPDNMIIGVKPGMTGNVRTVTLKQTDADPESDTYNELVPIDLTDWTDIAMIVSQNNGPVMIDAPGVADPDQVANIGKVTFTFDSTYEAFPNITLGEHQLEFRGLDPDGELRIFPVRIDGSPQFGTFIVSETWAD